LRRQAIMAEIEPWYLDPGALHTGNEGLGASPRVMQHPVDPSVEKSRLDRGRQGRLRDRAIEHDRVDLEAMRRQVARTVAAAIFACEMEEAGTTSGEPAGNEA